MTSLQTSLKQIPANAGFYIAVASVETTVYANVGTDSLPSFNNGAFTSTVSTATTGNQAGTYYDAVLGAGGVLRDMGKSLVSSGRSFRKVQLMVSTGQSLYNNGTDGVGGVDSAPTNYLTGYIELPSFGTVGGNSGAVTPVARLG